MVGVKRTSEIQEERPWKRLALINKSSSTSSENGQKGGKGDTRTGSESPTSEESEPGERPKGRRGGYRQILQGKSSKLAQTSNEKTNFLNGTSSRDTHAKQRALAQERKALKPNASSVARSKKLWERLRRKSHVPKEERKKLLAELFSIVTGHVRDFVFKHDAARVVQTALKYATPEQRKSIAMELKGDYWRLAQGKYSKFLIGKLLVHGDEQIRDLIIPEFYGHVNPLIRHPEASWIVDDVYRTVATREQKGRMLLEWYGPRYTMFKDVDPFSSLSDILEQRPEHRRPIMQHLHEMINQMVQKKTTGFTMLHDAMLQYYLNINPGVSEHAEFYDMLGDDEEGDCYKNLAFTGSGSRLVCLLLASSDAKHRRSILRVYKGVIDMLAFDRFGHRVLLTAYDVIDDTVMSSKIIFGELLGNHLEPPQLEQKLLGLALDLTGRIPLLYLLSHIKPKWLLLPGDSEIVEETHRLRTSTSKKDPETRRQELAKPVSEVLLPFVSEQAAALVSSSYGCQFIVEVLFDVTGDKTQAFNAIAALASEQNTIFDPPHAGRMLKSLVQGGRWNPKHKVVDFVDPPLGFEKVLFENIKDEVTLWAMGPRWRVVLAMMESGDEEMKKALKDALGRHRRELEEADWASIEGAGAAKGKLLEALDDDSLIL